VSGRDTRWAAVATAVALTAVVAGAAGALSFSSLRELAVSVYLPAALAPLYPAAIDGMLGVATLAAVLHRTAPLRTRAYIWSLIAAAIAVSVAGNALHATGHGGAIQLPPAMAALASAVPAASLAAALHLLVVIVRTPDRTSVDHRVAAKAATGADIRRPSRERNPSARVRRLVAHRPDIGAAEVARKVGVSERQARRLLAEARRLRVVAEES
jgi:hypothetical protein